MVNELSLPGEENYGVFTEYVLLDQHDPVIPQFKVIPFFTPSEFLHSFYGADKQPDILNVSYEYFAISKTMLESYGLLSAKDDLTKTLILKYNTKHSHKSDNNAVIFKFSGKILLKNDLQIYRASVLFDAPSFIGQPHKLYIKGSYPYEAIVYIRDTDAAALHLKDIASLWVSGAVNLDSLQFTLWEGSRFNNNCGVNLAPNSMFMVKNALDITNVNCVNIGGVVEVDKDISILFGTGYGEFYIGPNASIKAPVGEMTIRYARKILAINKGIMFAKKLSYNSEFLHNNGTIATSEAGSISVTKLFNYGAGEIVSNLFSISTIEAFYNSGNVTIADCRLFGPDSELNSGIIYNVGNITTNNFYINGKTHFLNHHNGIIRSANELACRLHTDPWNPKASKDIINFGGNLYAGAMNVDVDSITNLQSQFVVKKLGGAVQSMECFDSNCSYGLNMTKLPQIAASNSTMIVVSEGPLNVTVTRFFIGVANKPQVLPAIASANSTNATVTSPPTDEGFTLLIGNYDIQTLLLNNGKVIVGNNLMAIGLSGNESAVNTNVTIGALAMQNSILMTNKGGQVFIGTMDSINGTIQSLGNVTVRDRMHAQVTLNISGNVNMPPITGEVNLILDRARLAINGDMFNDGLITVVRDSVIITKAFVQSGVITGDGGLKIEASEFAMRLMVNAITNFVSRHNFIESKGSGQIKVDLKGMFELDVDKTVVIEGTSITADKIKIKAGDKVIVMPTSLYNRIHQYWGGGYRIEEIIRLVVPELTGENGIEIVSNNGISLYTGKYDSGVPIILNTSGIVSIEGVAEGNKLDQYREWYKSYWLVEKTFTEHRQESHFYPNLPEFTEALQITAGEGLSIIGVRIEGKGQTEFHIGKEGMSVLAKMAPMMEIHLLDYHSASSKSFLGLIPLGHKVDRRYQSIQIPHLNLINSTGGVKAYINGTFVQIGTNVFGNFTVNATEAIYLESPFAITYAKSIHESISFKVLKLDININEFSLGISGTYKKTVESSLEIIPIEAIYRGNLHLIAPEVNTMGINGQGCIFMVTAETWTDSPAEARFSSGFSIIRGSAEVKLGIKTGFGNFINNLDDTLKGAQDGSTEGLINAGFAAYAACLAGVEILAGNSFSAGAWVELSASVMNQRSNIVKVVPSQFNYSNVTIDLDSGKLTGTQLNAYNAYIQAKKELKLSSAKNSASMKQSYAAVDVNIPLSPGAPIGINLAGGKAEQYVEQHLHFVLKVQNELKISVLGKATMVGTTISGRSLDLSFGQLVLESVKNLIKRESSGANLGFTSDSITGIGAEYSNGLSEMVDEITSIVGTEKIKVVVAEALHLNGAMMANAQRDENGKLTDLGNLEVLAGLLFVQHIYTYDNGITFGASMEAGRKMSKESNNAYRVSFGMDSGDGIVRATIGKGKSPEDDQLNRDIDKVIEFEYNIKLKTIHVYYKERDEDAESQALNNLEDIFGEETNGEGDEEEDTHGEGDEDSADQYVYGEGDADDDAQQASGMTTNLQLASFDLGEPEDTTKGQFIKLLVGIEQPEEYLYFDYEPKKERGNKTPTRNIGIPTIGVGYALIIRVGEDIWVVRPENDLKEIGIILSENLRANLEKLAKEHTRDKSKPITSNYQNLVRLIKEEKFTIDKKIMQQAFDRAIRRANDDAKKAFSSDVWNKFSDQERYAIASAVYHHGSVTKGMSNAFKSKGHEGLFNYLYNRNNKKDGREEGQVARARAEATLFKTGSICPSGKYCVGPNENLERIAKKLGITEKELIKLNPIIETNNKKVFSFQALNIPK